MSFRRKGLLYQLPIIAIAILVFGGVSYADPTVNIVGPGGSCTIPSSDYYTVCATVSGFSYPVTKMVFYRNDVPVETDMTSTYQLTPSVLGQDTYTFRARAYDSMGAWYDSANHNLTIKTPRVFKMGVDAIPQSSPLPPITTSGPGELTDHTAQVQAALDYLSGLGGGTLAFPCKIPSGEQSANYNIKDTINVPSNVTLQGEGAEEVGRCRLQWRHVGWFTAVGCFDNDPNYPLLNKPMFRIAGDRTRIRFKDLWIRSRSSGPNCYPRYDWNRIDDENTVAIEMNTEAPLTHAGDITDVIIENVSISNFTYGIKAVSSSSSTKQISNIKLRAYRPVGNFRQLYINANYAHNWDVQNFNINNMMTLQGGIEIVKAGKPGGATGENAKMKFLQVNCNGQRDEPAAFCVRVEKHGGLYFRQLHHEGVNRAILVDSLSLGTNTDPIVFESSIASGLFKDASMKLYLIGNTVGTAPEPIQSNWDDIRLRFSTTGLDSTVVDCGDIHWDYTDVDGLSNPFSSWKMMYTHSERNRGSFFSESGGSVTKAHTYCPAGDPVNINEVGGDLFDSGLLPTEAATPEDTAKLYSNVVDSSTYTTCHSGDVAACIEDYLDYSGSTPHGGGAVYIKGPLPVNRTINIPKGSLIVGAVGAQLTLETTTPRPLLRITLPLNPSVRTSAIVIRNLKLKTALTGATTGIEITGQTPVSFPGDVPPSSDVHFSGLTFEGFNTGLKAWPPENPSSPGTYAAQPMLDGYSMKNLSFTGSAIAVDVFSANTSNWNVMNLSMQSSTANAVGWNQYFGGHIGMQGVSCQGTEGNYMKDCLYLRMVNIFYLNSLKRTQYTTNAVTIAESDPAFFDAPYYSRQYATLNFRNNDFTSAGLDKGRMNVIGKSFITSMNNKYGYFNVDQSTEADQSRLTYCNDDYTGGGGPYPGLDPDHPNNWVGKLTPTRVACGTRPMPWEDAVRLGGDAGDKPMVGNFYDNVREDYVIYRPGAQSQFLIRQAGGNQSKSFQWGTASLNDVPLIGRFYPGQRSQVIVYRRSTSASSQWYAMDPFSPAGCNTTTPTCTTYAWTWGIYEDIPLVGNFIKEYPSDPDPANNKDEIAIYRPSIKMFCIYNPRSGTMVFRTTTADATSTLHVADFLGAGYDQIAQYKNGTWQIINIETGASYTADVTLGQAGDIPVAGRYLPTLSGKQPCAQLGVWRASDQTFNVKDPFSALCGSRSTSMQWGSLNEFGGSTSSYADDIPLTINKDSTLRRPTVYRPTVGAFPQSIANGQWWVHDLF